MPLKLKRCTLCKVSKTIHHFNKNNSKNDGLQSHCRECNRSKSRKYYLDNKTYHKKQVNKRRKENKKFVQQYVYNFLKENGCIDCGENDPCCLDFDHLIDKKKEVSTMVGNNYSLSSILKEISKCEIRCANCHRRKTANQQGWYRNIKTK